MLSSIGNLASQTLSINNSNNAKSKQTVSRTLSQTSTESNSNNLNSVKESSGDVFSPVLNAPKQYILSQSDIQLKDLNLSQGTALTTDHLKLETTKDSKQDTINTPDQIKQEVPRSWKLPAETMKSFTTAHNAAIDRSSEMDLSFEERKDYLQKAKNDWVEDKRQNDPEMFVEWLKLNKDKIFNGQLEEVGLPSDFTIEDYHSYVKETISIWA